MPEKNEMVERNEGFDFKEALNEVKEELTNVVKTVTKKELENMIKEKRIAVPEYDGETRKDVKSFFKALVSRDYIALKSLSEGTDSAGGYLVPEEFSNKVLDIASDVGYLRRLGTVLNMGSDTLNVPKLSSKPSVSWVSEGGQISTGDPAFGQVQLTAKKASLIVPVTTELFEDSAVDLTALLSKIFAEALTSAEDTQAFTGDGTVFTGILGDSNVNTVTMSSGKTGFTDITADNLINLIAAVPSRVAERSAFFMNRGILAIIKSLTDGSGNYLFDPKDKTIWGYPVYTIESMPAVTDSAADTAFIAFGDPSYLYLGDRRQMSVALADQATVGSDNLFEKDMIAVRVTERVAIAVAMSNAFAVLKTAAS